MTQKPMILKSPEGTYYYVTKYERQNCHRYLAKEKRLATKEEILEAGITND